MEAPDVAQRPVAEVLGRHRDRLAGVLVGGQVDDPRQLLRQQFSEVRVFAVEHVLVQVELVARVALDALADDALHVEVDVLVEVVDRHVPAVRALPLVPLLVLVHRLQSFDGDAGEALRRIARVLEHVVEPIPDHDVRLLDAVVHQPLDHGVDDLGPRVDEGRADGVHLEADHVARVDQELEALLEVLAGEAGYAFLDHLADHFPVERLADEGSLVGHLHDLARERAREGPGRLRDLHEVSEVRLGRCRRRGRLPKRRPGEHQAACRDGRSRAHRLHEVATGRTEVGGEGAVGAPGHSGCLSANECAIGQTMEPGNWFVGASDTGIDD